MERTKKVHLRKSQGFKTIIFFVVVLICAQIWFLYANYKEIITKLPNDLFTSPAPFPVSEMIVNSGNISTDGSENGTASVAGAQDDTQSTSLEESIETMDTSNGSSGTDDEVTQDTTGNSTDEYELTGIQKKIVLRLMELLNEDIKYGYQLYPDSGYPTDNVWISTDVISVVLKDCGYDLMELIYQDMLDHKEDYPLDEIKNRKDPLKYADFRDVFFQEKFFKRNALELSTEFIAGDKDNTIQWQPGDIVYFQFDPDNPYQDLGGFISSRSNDNGIPLVIMIDKDLGKVSEVDKLTEYKIVGHYRYPNPYK
jgi:uncharacterized protein